MSLGLRLLLQVPPLIEALEPAPSLARDLVGKRPQVIRARLQPLPQTWPLPTCDSVEVGNNMQYQTQRIPGTPAYLLCTKEG